MLGSLQVKGHFLSNAVFGDSREDTEGSHCGFRLICRGSTAVQGSETHPSNPQTLVLIRTVLMSDHRGE